MKYTIVDKSLIAEPTWIKKEIQYLADCVDTAVKKGKVIEITKKMNGMPLHHAKKLFRNFIDTCDKFPSIKDFSERITFYENLDREDLKKLEQNKTSKPEYNVSVLDEVKIAARPMKLLLKKDPEKFHQIKEVYERYFPNVLAQANNKNSHVENRDLKVNACYGLMNEFYTNPKRVFQNEIDSRVPGVVQSRLIEGLKECQRSKGFFGNTAS
ncbi:MAG: hypothetical protein KC646_06895 [Candidatus Cloacimonetes bacterium]|nr:hypothetical protein [Candidatus Cloacimonadota bacterium]